MNLKCKALIVILALSLSTNVLAESLKESLHCLKEVVYFESRSESFAGQLAVALVVKNRVEDSRWPDSYCEVAHQKHQFSYYWDGKHEKYLDKKAERRADQVANLVYFGATLDFTEGAKYYHTTKIRPDWDYAKIEPVGVFDNHIFYKDK